MRIVYATDNYWPRTSGIAVSIDAFKRALTDLGHEIYVFAPDYPGAAEYDRNTGDTNIVRFPSVGLRFLEEDRLTSPFHRHRVFAAMESIKPDIIHVHTEFNMGIYSGQYARRHGIPLVFTAHTFWEEYSNYISIFPDFFIQRVAAYLRRAPFKYSNLITVPSAAMKSVLLSYGDKNHEQQPIEIIPTGISRSDFGGAAEKIRGGPRSIAGIDLDLEDRKVLLYVGRIGIEKNIDFLISAAAEIRKSVPNVVLLVVGDGPHRENLEEAVRRRGLERHVFFTGYVERKELKQIYSLADVFVFASKTETQGLVINEAMQCGTPVVAIGAMGILDVMHDNIGGFLVADDMGEFCEKTMLLLDDPAIHEQKSTEALAFARDWNSETQALKMQAVYESVL